MNVRELIKELVDEPDLDSTVYVRVVDEHGKEHFYPVLCLSFKHQSIKTGGITCTTIDLDM